MKTTQRLRASARRWHPPHVGTWTDAVRRFIASPSPTSSSIENGRRTRVTDAVTLGICTRSSVASSENIDKETDETPRRPGPAHRDSDTPKLPRDAFGACTDRAGGRKRICDIPATTRSGCRPPPRSQPGSSTKFVAYSDSLNPRRTRSRRIDQLRIAPHALSPSRMSEKGVRIRRTSS